MTQVVPACPPPACSAYKELIGLQQQMKWWGTELQEVNIPPGTLFPLLRPSPGQVARRILTGGSVCWLPLQGSYGGIAFVG